MREEVKARRAQYRLARKQLDVERGQLLQGKISHDTGHGAAPGPSGDPPSRGCSGRQGVGAGGASTEGKPRPHNRGAMSTVLGSLEKLVELEKRVSCLERSNVYGNYCADLERGAGSAQRDAIDPRALRRKAPGAASSVRGGGAPPGSLPFPGKPSGRADMRRSCLSFSKQRTDAMAGVPSQVFYSVRVNRGAPMPHFAEGGPRRSRPGEPRRSSAFPRTRVEKANSARARGARPTFLTNLPDVHRKPWERTKDESRGRGIAAGARRPGGCGFQSTAAERKRPQAKQGLARGRAEAARIERQDRIIREWIQHKRTAAAAAATATDNGDATHGRRRSKVPGSRATPGVERRVKPRPGRTEAPRRLSNAHLQEFRDIRDQYCRRTERLRRDLSRRNRGPGIAAGHGGTRTTSLARPRLLPSSSTSTSRGARGLHNQRGIERGGGPREAWGVSQGCPGGKIQRRGTRGTVGRQGEALVVGGTGLGAAKTWGQRSSLPSKAPRGALVGPASRRRQVVATTSRYKAGSRRGSWGRGLR